MPVREMTPEEKKAWLGNGLVLFGQKPPANWRGNSAPAAPEAPQATPKPPKAAIGARSPKAE